MKRGGGCAGGAARGMPPPPAALAATLLAALLVPLPPLGAAPMAKARVIIHGHTLTAEIADTPELQVRGLSGRPRVAPDEGMLFVYADEGERRFWMRDMLIPIDMIWLRNHRVVHIEVSVPPPPPGTQPGDLPTYRSAEPANLVLELAAGRARELGLKVGDRVEFMFH